ncbi:predicted protein [Postia placenta Mad-698-R]|uniref:Uncharacterized protein n=1 Tax=Postia placenta MAD-698-R-SB12 TaxID=670580 RepID=A0A1X6N822_9APHY|nr:hypothetical protein POSPLADRAFT_1134575 [Postia placenta MAD-698-R-SB12]EED79567.1 predicted protein [Postia placenta Mad-698-R]OSX64616.1 hypothetical protein POSPLADRAFT_1134575 [Postia placenta MAD-698-R-SB12]
MLLAHLFSFLFSCLVSAPHCRPGPSHKPVLDLWQPRASVYDICLSWCFRLFATPSLCSGLSPQSRLQDSILWRCAASRLDVEVQASASSGNNWLLVYFYFWPPLDCLPGRLTVALLASSLCLAALSLLYAVGMHDRSGLRRLASPLPPDSISGWLNAMDFLSFSWLSYGWSLYSILANTFTYVLYPHVNGVWFYPSVACAKPRRRHKVFLAVAPFSLNALPTVSSIAFKDASTLSVDQYVGPSPSKIVSSLLPLPPALSSLSSSLLSAHCRPMKRSYERSKGKPTCA